MEVCRVLRAALLASNFRPEAQASRASGILSRVRQAAAARYQALRLRGLRVRAWAQSLLQEPKFSVRREKDLGQFDMIWVACSMVCRGYGQGGM